MMLREQSDRLQLVQVDLAESKVYVASFHAHSKAHVGHKLSLGAAAGGRIVGVAVIGRPSSRVLATADEWALEVTRVCVERDEDGRGYPNACSFLYGASWRAIRALGFLRALTYTKDGEDGGSIRAAGWVHAATRAPRTKGWDTDSRRRADDPIPGGDRWEIRAADWRSDLPGRPRVTAPTTTNTQEAMHLAA